MAAEPYTIGRFVSDDGTIQLEMVGTHTDGRPSKRSPMKSFADAARWSSQQAAWQYLKRNRPGLKGDGWRVIDLRRLTGTWE